MGCPLNSTGQPIKPKSPERLVMHEEEEEVERKPSPKKVAKTPPTVVPVLRRKPLVSIDLTILNDKQRIDLFREDDPVLVVTDFCRRHKLVDTTKAYLIEKITRIKVKAVRKLEKKKKEKRVQMELLQKQEQEEKAWSAAVTPHVIASEPGSLLSLQDLQD